jgi:VanZ family protein
MLRIPGKTTMAWALVILVLSLLPVSDPGDLGALPHLDKIIHVFFYATLSFLTLRDIISGKKDLASNPGFYLQAFLYALIFGVLIELVQWALPYRSFEFMDILANAFGACCGLVIFFLFYRGRIAEKN